MLNDLLDEFAKEYDLVLLDGAPFLGFAEALHAAAAVSGVVIVATSGKTTHKALEQTLTSLSWLRANVLGVVLNRTHDTTQPNYGYAAYYRDGAHRRGILKSRADRLSQQS
jgi:polysaccharide biosynthesis transport protein